MAIGQTHELNNLDAERILVHMKLAEMLQGTLSGGLMYQKSDHISRPLEGDAVMAELAFARDSLTYKLQWQRDDSKIRAKETGTLWELRGGLRPAKRSYHLCHAVRSGFCHYR